MGVDLIQAKYEALESIAVRFGNESERVGEVNGRIQQAMHALQNGGWEGQGSQAFFTEMQYALTDQFAGRKGLEKLSDKYELLQKMMVTLAADPEAAGAASANTKAQNPPDEVK